MLKKHLTLLLIMLVTVVTASAGTWKTHSSYMKANIKNVFDVGEKVYYLNGDALSQFEKSTQTTTALSSQNVLSDSKIDQIYYDYERKLLFVAYVNNNIDVIDASGRVINVSTLKDMPAPIHGYTLDKGLLAEYTEHKIHDITFANGIAYVATGDGYAAIDETTFRVVDNKVLGETLTINSVAVIGDMMVIITNTYCYYGPATSSDPINEFVRVRAPGSQVDGKIYPIDNHSIFVLGAAALYNFDFSTGEPVTKTLVSAKPTSVQKTANGFVANFEGKKFYYTIDATGKTATQASTVIGFASSDPAGDGTVWILDADGLHVLNSTEYYKLSSLTTADPYWLKYNTAMDVLYVSNSAKNGETRADNAPLLDNVINVYDGQTWSDETPYTVYGSGYEFVFLPFDSTTYVRASWNRGIHKVTNNVLKTNYTKENSLVGTYKAQPAFDKNGNMWVVSSYTKRGDNPDTVVYNGVSLLSPPAAVLPKNKVTSRSVKTDDWILPSGLGALDTRSMQRSRFIISKKNNVKIYSDCEFLSTSMQGRILCWDNGNDNPAVDNYKISSIYLFADQNNNQIKWSKLSHMEEDADGLIWVGHLTGLFVFDPEVAFDIIPKATRPYVTQAEISDDLGRLCEGYTVYDIAIDRENCKWIGTNNGLYYVSPDGTIIYEHFTAQNSGLPDNNVYSVEYDVVHKRVFMCTDNGLTEYDVDVEPAATSFDEVSVYPNPVSPDFTSMIKISNLMEDTYLTIADRAGNTVVQMGPVTSSALWNGCGADGDRVPTGVYNIFASQGSFPVANGTPQATVLIIK